MQIDLMSQQGPGCIPETTNIINSRLQNSPITINIHGINLRGRFWHRVKLAWRLITGRLGLVTEHSILIQGNIVTVGDDRPGIRVDQVESEVLPS